MLATILRAGSAGRPSFVMEEFSSQSTEDDPSAFLGAYFDHLRSQSEESTPERRSLSRQTSVSGGASSSQAQSQTLSQSQLLARQRSSQGILRRFESEEEEVVRLLGYRAEIKHAEERNAKIQSSLREATQAANEALVEVEGLYEYLDAARSFAAGLDEASVNDFSTTSVRLPLFPDIYHHIPLLAYQDQEIEELRSLTFTCARWGNDDVKHLRLAVKKECFRIAARRLRASRRCADPLAMLADIDEKDLLSLSCPRQLDDTSLAGVEAGEVMDYQQEEIDWDFVAREVGFRFNGEQCRTRWLHYDAPMAADGRTWSVDELQQLHKVVQQIGQTNWEAIANRMGSTDGTPKRSAMACFCAYQSHDSNPDNLNAKPVEWTTEETVKLLELDRTWDHRIEIVAEKLQTSRTAAQVNSQARLFDKIRLRNDDVTRADLREAASDPAARKRLRRTGRAGNLETIRVTNRTSDASKKSKWTKKDEELFVTLLERTNNFLEVSKQLGRSKASCFMKWHKLGLGAMQDGNTNEKPGRANPLDDELKARILKLKETMREAGGRDNSTDRAVEEGEEGTTKS